MFTNTKGFDHIKVKVDDRNYCVSDLLFRAGIGDGGNDVGMIQLASIGLGIVGK